MDGGGTNFWLRSVILPPNIQHKIPTHIRSILLGWSALPLPCSCPYDEGPIQTGDRKAGDLIRCEVKVSIRGLTYDTVHTPSTVRSFWYRQEATRWTVHTNQSIWCFWFHHGWCFFRRLASLYLSILKFENGAQSFILAQGGCPTWGWRYRWVVTGAADPAMIVYRSVWGDSRAENRKPRFLCVELKFWCSRSGLRKGCFYTPPVCITWGWCGTTKRLDSHSHGKNDPRNLTDALPLSRMRCIEWK